MKKINKLLNEENSKLNIKDYILLGIILFIYSIISFINLGSMESPNTFLSIDSTKQIIIELKNSDYVATMKVFSGNRNSQYQIYTSLDNKTYKYINDFEGNGSFSWQNERILETAKYIKILFLDNSDIGEIAFYNNSQKKISIKKITYNNKKITTLTDEENTIPNEVSYMNSTYFDEIYFARTAYEYVNGIKTYEWTHPPLGKLIQAIPIYLTNYMSPFNYRLMGNIAGIIMIAIMYIYAHVLFKKRKYALFASLLMMFDTFHFAHTRMGTVDSYLVLFILLESLFMTKYVKEEKVKCLFLSGLFFGLSISVKWTGFYEGLGLAIIFFTYLIKNKKLKINKIIQGILFFIVIPLIIYNSLYLLFPNNNINYTDNISSIISQQKEMYNYHANLKDKHPFSSAWYTWPISYKPVWYHQEILENNTKETISGVGNIVIWWMGIISSIYLVIKAFKKKDITSFILLVSILSLWLPYSFINRVMFLYHFFPVLPFVMLGIVNLFKDMETKFKKNYLILIYLIPVIIFFIVYYPVVSGYAVKIDYINKLKLLSSWIF